MKSQKEEISRNILCNIGSKMKTMISTLSTPIKKLSNSKLIKDHIAVNSIKQAMFLKVHSSNQQI